MRWRGSARIPVGVFAYELPVAGGGQPEDAGYAFAALGTANEVKIDDTELPVVGELGKREAEDIVAFGGQDRIGLVAGDADGFFQPGLFPEIRIAGEIDLFGQFIEDTERQGFEQVIFDPFVIVIFEKAAGVRSGNEVIMIERAVYDSREDGIDEFFGAGEICVGGGFLRTDVGARRRFLRPGRELERTDQQQGQEKTDHASRSGKGC